MDSICKFLPSKSYTGNIKTVHFVYETEFHNLKQPFIRPIYYAHIVTSGNGVIKYCGKEEALTVGSLFFFFPAIPYEIQGSEDFKYIYISFMGAGVSELFDSLDISLNKSVFHDHSAVCDLWINSILKINKLNANILSESMLMYALSFVCEQNAEKSDITNENLIDLISSYVDMHFTEPDLYLKRVASVFGYTEKYLSYLFKSKMGNGFNTYLVNLRMQYALSLIASGVSSVSEIAVRCGYSDPLYFSKAFKKHVNMSPTEYISKKHSL